MEDNDLIKKFVGFNMKTLLLIVALLPTTASAINLTMKPPASVVSLSVTPTVKFTVDCKAKEITIEKTENHNLSRFIKNKVGTICYRDSGKYNVTYHVSGYGAKNNMHTTQQGRFMESDNFINKESAN